MKKTKTIGFIPTIDGKPGRWCEWQREDGTTEGQICLTGSRNNPITISPTRDAVRYQIEKTLTFRTLNGYARPNERQRYRIQRVVAL